MNAMRKMKRMMGVLMAVLMLCGCQSKAHYEEVEKKALAYYRDKYDANDVGIIDSYKAGNSGLFGYADVKDRAYELSDGYSVYWNEEEGYFADDRQAKEILDDFDEKILLPLLEKGPERIKCSRDHYLNRTYFDSFDEMVFKGYYDGNITEYLKEERPELQELTVVIEEDGTYDHEAYAEELYRELDAYVKGHMWIVVTDKEYGLFDTDIEDSYVSAGERGIVSRATVWFDDRIYWYRQNYIEVADGVFISSGKADFMLEEGDVKLELIEEEHYLQDRLDEAYFAMPVDAEENSKGGYMVHDQRHEKRTVLDDPDEPCYRLLVSGRVKEAMNGNCLDVYVYDERNDGRDLMVRYEDGRYGYELFRVCESDGEPEAHQLRPGSIYCFGAGYSLEEYLDE